MKMTNMKIYDTANALGMHFQDKEMRMPVKVNFFLQKNRTVLTELAQEIEKNRVEIIQKYSTTNEETGETSVAPENTEAAMKELEDLFTIEQDVKIHKVNVDDFKELSLTAGQMEALIFMIED